MSDFGRALHVLALELVSGIAFGFLLFCATANAQVRYTDFSMLGQRHASLIADTNGTLAVEPVVVPISPSVSHIQWRAPGKAPIYWEVFELKHNPATSTNWWFLTAFCSPGICDPIATQRATLEIGGQVFEIGRPEIQGHPYAPEFFTAPYTIRIWGWSGPTTFHWRASMSMPSEVSNPLWLTTPQKARLAIRQDEAWWDGLNGWEEGASDLSWSRFNYLGKGVGIGYIGENMGWRYGAAWAWSY